MTEALIAFQNGAAPSDPKWNTVNSPAAGVLLSSFNTVGGGTRSWTLSLDSASGVTANSFGPTGVGSGEAAWVDDPIVVDRTWVFTFSRTLTLGGLDPAKTYDLEFFGSNDGATGAVSVSIGGTPQILNIGNNLTDTVLFAGVSPTAGGAISVTVSQSASPARLNAMRIIENGASVSASVTSSTSVTATIPVTGTDGTVFAVASLGATAPTPAQIEAGTDAADVAAIDGSTPVTAAGDIDVTLTGLTANTEYHIHAVHKSAGGVYGAVASTTVTPNPVLSGTLETGADTPYVDGGNWTVAVLNADMAGITTAMVTPDATGAIRIVDALLPISTEVVVASIAPDGTNGVIGKLTTSA